MFDLCIPKLSERLLIETILEPTNFTIDTLERREDVSVRMIDEIVNRKNKIIVEVPYCINITSKLAECKSELTLQTQKTLDNYDFYFASLGCSFRSDDNCTFIWGRLGLILGAESSVSDGLDRKIIAQDVFPTQELKEIIYERKTCLTPEIEFSFKSQKATDLLSIEAKKELIIYQPQITAYGIQRSNLSWDFLFDHQEKKGARKSDLLLIIKTQKNIKPKAEFLLAAEVEFQAEKTIQIPLAKKNEDISVENFSEMRTTL